ncbi:MAG: hypothetical protein WBD31_25895, partial [Rubripirellula sp.]
MNRLNSLSIWITVAIATCFLTTSTINAEEAGGLPAGDVEIVVDLDTEVGEMYNFWNVYPVTDQSPFLDEQQFDQLRQKYRYAKYINCVRLLGGINRTKNNYFRGVDNRGEAVCDFSEAIAMLTGIRKCGFTPWIGTERDLNPGQWTGTKEQWLKHYDYTVAAVRGVLPGAEIGPGNVVAPLKARRQ